MAYLLWTLVLAVGIASVEVVRETSTEYFANWVAENETQNLGASTKSAPPDPLLDDALATASAAPVQPVIEPPRPILVSGSPMAPASDGNAPALAVIPVSATQVAPNAQDQSTTPGGQWWLTVRPAAEELPPASLDDSKAQAVLSVIRDTPYRRPDGTVFLPITTQRLFSMRSMVTREAAVPLTYEIPGRVVTNPATATTIQAAQPGRLEAADSQFPYLGMQVKKGDLLAYLRPTFGVAERAQIEARIQQLVNQISLSKKQIARLEEVLFVRYRVNKIEALQIEIEGNRRELAALESALERRQELRANADGVISHVQAVRGAAVQQNQALFDIVDPAELWVEAAAYDPAIAADVRDAAALTANKRAILLTFVGGGLELANQAVPLRFRVASPAAGLSVGEPVSVIVRSQHDVRGIPVPSQSVVRDSDGRSLVWERRSAEIFVPHYIQAKRLGGDAVVVEAGLSNGMRIVTSGGAILSQVR
jgi:cobalt-zinc-cadmium efflux system membrane fusion protein